MDTYTKRYNSELVEKEFGLCFSSIEEAKANFIKYFGDIDKFKGGNNQVRESSMKEDMALVAFGFCHICSGVGGYWSSCCSHRACPCASTNQAFYINSCGFCDGTGKLKEEKEVVFDTKAHKDQFKKSEEAIFKFEKQKKEAERDIQLEEENQDYRHFTDKERNFFKDGIDCLINSREPFELDVGFMRMTKKTRG